MARTPLEPLNKFETGVVRIIAPGQETKLGYIFYFLEHESILRVLIRIAGNKIPNTGSYEICNFDNTSLADDVRCNV